MTQPAPGPLAIVTPAQPARGAATAFVQRITASAAPTVIPVAAKPTLAGTAGSILADVLVGAPLSGGLGVGYAKGVVTKARMLGAADAMEALALATASSFPTVSAFARRAGGALMANTAFVAGLEWGGGLPGEKKSVTVEKIAEVDAEL